MAQWRNSNAWFSFCWLCFVFSSIEYVRGRPSLSDANATGDAKVVPPRRNQAISCIPGDTVCTFHNGFALSEDVVIAIEMVTKDFLLLAYTKAKNARVTELMSNVSKDVNHLLYGNLPNVAPPPAGSELTKTLEKLASTWSNYKSFLQSNFDSVQRTSSDVLMSVSASSKEVHSIAKKVQTLFTGYANAMGSAVPLREARARQQLYYVMTLAKDAFFIDLNIEAQYYLEHLASAKAAFIAAHSALVDGNVAVGITGSSEFCILYEMFRVEELWLSIDQSVSSIESTGTTEEIVLFLAENDEGLADAMRKALQRFIHDDGRCDVKHENEAAWSSVIAAMNMVSLQVQKTARRFLELAIGYDIVQGEMSLRESLQIAGRTLRSCMKGSAKEEILPPPTQEISDAFARVWEDYHRLEVDVKSFLDIRDFSPPGIHLVAEYSKLVLNDMDAIAEMTVVFALEAGISRQLIIQETSWRQVTLVEKMSKEALLICLGKDTAANDAELQSSFQNFGSSHEELLNGRAETDPVESFGDLSLPRAENVCILNDMMHVWHRFSQMKLVLQTIRESNKSSDQTELLVHAHEMDHQIAQLTGALLVVSKHFHTGMGECSTKRSKKVWEASINAISQLPFKLEKSMSEFFLLSANFSQIWMAQSQQTLQDHRGYILQEAGTEMVIQAIRSFSRAWDSFRNTDEERAISLQVAYVTLNPHPTGMKDQLDFAEGEEEYHKIHGQFHPTYRATLYERNYYDIFMFNMRGDLIYSVYKELDYATNFAADGTGKWKDSGLGDAFRAALKHPDSINVIDWKPYGPSYGAMASFLSTGVRDENGALIGVFSTQLPPESIPLDSVHELNISMDGMTNFLEVSKFGKFEEIHPPPSQEIADNLFNVSDKWDTLARRLHFKPSRGEAAALNHEVGTFNASCDVLVQSFVSDAWREEPTLHAAKISLLWKQVSLAQRMTTETVGIALSISTRDDLKASIAAYEQNQRVLMSGNIAVGGTRRNSLDIIGTTDRAMLNLLDNAAAVWTPLKELVTDIADGREPSVTIIRSVVDNTATLVESMSAAASYLGSTTRTTTQMAIEILAPMPLTGAWAAGRTMRVAALLAESVINSDQNILPGFVLRTVFFDDKCDGSVSSQIILSQMAQKDTFVGLGGGGCDMVCAQSSVAASSIRLPFISYDCAGAELKDSTAYPGFSRLGTVTDATPDIVKALGDRFSWKHIHLISGIEQLHRETSDDMARKFQERGFSVKAYSAAVYKWDDILNVMRHVKETSKGLDRVVFFIGSESLYRKIVCASIVTGNRKGITWLSQGTWRKAWWQKSDVQTDFQLQWLKEDTAGKDLKDTFAEIKFAWDRFRPTVEATRTELQKLYQTDQKELLLVPDDAGEEEYHVVHRKWHSMWRRIMMERNYYDIFIFDLNGDMIYSVYKEPDFATNFAMSGNGPWKTSGLGEAFEAAKANPDEVHYIDWKPYGPSGGLDASFFSTGLRDVNDNLVGVYSIQLPPEFEKSIEEVVPDCSLEAMSESYEGAINIAGLGKPISKNLEKPLPCFDTHSPVSFMKLLDRHYEEGFPSGDRSTMVDGPYEDIKTAAADGTCIFAFTVRRLLDEGYSIGEIQTPNQKVYERFLEIVRTELDFQGVSGRVKFDGNDRPNFLGIHQVVQSSRIDIGLVNTSGEIDWLGQGPVNTSWTKEFPEPPPYFPYEVLQVLVPLSLIVCPLFFGILRGLLA
jgi:hypothetical protein